MVIHHEIMVELPQMLDPSAKATSRINRVHARGIKAGIEHALRMHHQKEIPDHFNFWKQKKYKYTPRSPETIAAKKLLGRDRADLVKTGATKKKMQKSIDRLRLGGSASSGRVTGTMTLRFPPGKVDPPRQRITVRVMSSEIARTVPPERTQLRMWMMEVYKRTLDQELSKRARTQVGQRLRQLGI